MKKFATVALVTSLMLGGITNASPRVDAVTEPALGRAWKANKSDNICGISDVKKVTKPAIVDYEKLLEATPQIKRMIKKGIDPDSTEGKALRQAASLLITKSAQAARKDGGFCGVWKAIAHRDGREVPEITSEVIGEF